MIASVLLILVAVVLLVAGLAGGSAPLLIISVAASLLAAVALVVGARQASGRRGGPAGPVAEPAIPHQHVPRSGGTGWRQPPGTPSGPDRPRPAPGPGTEEPLDEPDLQQVRPEDEALVAQLVTPVHVVQGRPRYHLASCPHLLERLPSRIPVAEAVELGFTPCAVCAPATALRADARNS